jgi:hypothetical protein
MDPVHSNTDNLTDIKNSEAHVEEVTIARLTDEAIFELSAESLTWKSWTGFRIFLVMIVQGSIMAGYGIDWSVIGGINNFDVCSLTYMLFLINSKPHSPGVLLVLKKMEYLLISEQTWHTYFDFGDTGSTLATFNALMTIGSVCAAPFLSFGDVIGRRGINFVGNAIGKPLFEVESNRVLTPFK